MSGLRDELPIFRVRSKLITTSTIFTVPPGVTMLNLSMVAGGGGGMSYYWRNGQFTISCLAGGGSGGWVDKATLVVQPGDQLEITIGTGGNSVRGEQDQSKIPPDPEVTIKGQDGGNTSITNLRTGDTFTVYGGEGAKGSITSAGDGGWPNGSGGGVWFTSVNTTPTRVSGGCGVYRGGGGYTRRSSGQAAVVSWINRTMGAGMYPGVGGAGGRAGSMITGSVNYGSGGDYNVDTSFAVVSTDLRSDVRPGKPGVVNLEWMA